MTDDRLLRRLARLAPAERERVLDGLPPAVTRALLTDLTGQINPPPATPIDQAKALDDGYVTRPHLLYLSDRLTQALADVRNGRNRHLVVSMPPRSGKSTLSSIYLPTWLLRQNPRSHIGMISHDPSLATAWGRQVRRVIERHGAEYDLALAPDAGAASEWETTTGGSVLSRSAPGQSITGRGFNVLILDDVVKDFAAAHSETQREAVWDWWLANAVTRLEPPYLVIVIGTRWHADDFIGRLLSAEYQGDPGQWEVISFPAIAEDDDVLGRSPGEPLLSPLVPDETSGAALDRWEATRRTVGSYAWAALYQQRPAPPGGAIFTIDAFKYWTTDPALADGATTVLLDEDRVRGGRWVDSWDLSFTGSTTSDYTVGQRWVAAGPDRFLIAQQRGRWDFSMQLDRIRAWTGGGGPYGRLVHKRLVEKAANGAAILDTLDHEVPGMTPVIASRSKDVRYHAVTPEVESGHVYLPHPSEEPWVQDLVAELREAPHGKNDDQADALAQALVGLRDPQGGAIHSPTVEPRRRGSALTEARLR